MRFLCLHGRGTNAKIFEKQTSRIREALGREHEFVFINGAVPSSPAAGFETGSDPPHFQWVSSDWNQRHELYQGLVEFIVSEGPFDGLMAFSEGASVAAQLLIEDARHRFGHFRCAILFSAPLPSDAELVSRGIIVEAATAGILVDIPTAHIWSEKGDIYPGAGRELALRCNPDLKEEFVHDLGHEIPGFRNDEGFAQTVRAIERTIEQAKALD
ncbi:hypothetical protein F4778DRAFT_684058 [Xylariomycetidae sp. FL2044]|nr:hypothetical protein F4778DRAFT_684058 [Xylariomycetidae sp. FL2044]